MKVGVFIGVETEGWGVANFVDAAKTIKQEGADTLLFKISDGADGDPTFVPINQQGLDICSAIKEEGITPIPYLFSYGDRFGGMASECGIANKYLEAGYDFCFDMESAFDGHDPTWGQFYEAHVAKPFLVSTWANVVDHNWHSTIAGLGLAVKMYMPQVYTSYDQDVFVGQYQLCGVPPTRLSPTYTPATLAHAIGFAAQGVSLWEIMSLQPGDVESVVKAVVPQPAPVNENFQREVADCWNSFFNLLNQGLASTKQLPLPPMHTGIFNSWEIAWTKKHLFGAALGYEYDSVDAHGTPLKCQNFCGVRCEYSNGVARWFGPYGEITF